MMDSYIYTLEKLALKNSSDDELFEHVKSIFDAQLRVITLCEDKGKKLDTSISKLRVRYKNLKAEWSRRQDKMYYDMYDY